MATKGIVESKGRLRATHHRFLNDIRELRFGYKLATEVLQGFANTIGAKVVALVRKDIDRLTDGDSFLACLSEEPHVLSQWRAYGDNGAGYCIGMRAEERLTGGTSSTLETRSCLLWQCKYDEDEIRRLIAARFQRKIDEFQKLPANPQTDDDLAQHLSSVADRYAHVAKHEHFREEAEWRVIVEESKPSLHYRLGKMGLTPFLETDPLPIEEVWIGPAVGPNRVLAKRITKEFLAQHEIDAEVHYWDSPFR